MGLRTTLTFKVIVRSKMYQHLLVQFKSGTDNNKYIVKKLNEINLGSRKGYF